MDIRVRYANGFIREDELDIFRRKYNSDIAQYGIQAGAIDLITILEVSATTFFSGIAYDYFKGLIGLDFFEELGKVSRSHIAEFRDLLLSIFDTSCSERLNQNKAIAYVDYQYGFSVYAVLNHDRSNRVIVSKLADTFEQVYRKLPTIINSINDNVVAIQLYPDFEENEWRYLFIPSTQAYGKFIDRAYDLKSDEFILFDSNVEFSERFSTSISEEFKFIITYNRDLDSL